MHAADHFLKLVDSGRPLAEYPGEGGRVYLACGPGAVQSVFRSGSLYACPSHPYRTLGRCLHPLGQLWLGIGDMPEDHRQLADRARLFFEGKGLFDGWTPENGCAPPSPQLLYLSLKSCCIALSASLLFDVDGGFDSMALARASDVIEDLRAGNATPGRRRRKADIDEARRSMRDFVEIVAARWGAAASAGEDLGHAVQETILSASVPMAYAWLWTLLLLGRDEDLQQRLREEAQSLRPTFETLRSSLVMAVIRESLRLYPPVWAMSRTSTANQTLAGTKIGMGQAVVVSPYALHRAKAFWHQPRRFSPERFAPGEPRPSVYLPYGAGKRTCPATRWNALFLAFAVQSFLKRYSLRIDRMPRALPLVALRPGLDFNLVVRNADRNGAETVIA